jgi:pimeloyl-ACP methyl ester carboxylesterase
MKAIRTATLEIGFEEHGPPDGPPVVLLHGFPDDVRTWDKVAPPLAARGWRGLVPWLRGYGPTRFLDPATPRSGQQAALGADLRDFIEALELGPCVLAGYDWGGRAACVVSALWPEKVRGLVSIGGYNIQDIARAASRPGLAIAEYRYWYQWYLHTERGRIGLTENRRDLCRLMWRLWSPNWQFDEATFDSTAISWDNPDFVEVCVHSYRHRYRQADGDPALEAIEVMLAGQPPIPVPTLVLEGLADGVGPPDAIDQAAAHFTAFYQRRLIKLAGHFLPREAPDEVVTAVCELAGRPFFF